MATMKLEIVTAERHVYSDEVSGVVAPGMEGELGILPNHAPLLTILQPGELRVMKQGEQDAYIAVSGGFLEVMANRVVVLAAAAERAEEIDEARAQEAMRRAEERIVHRGADVDLAQALASMHRAQARLKVARRRRHPPQAGGGG
ncbi:MAG: F0F1 ATP synthase subunit epsilon [Chloroflexi bacterium]|nr:F0F1 ATP synthase subunit epsilon [Chloroflexota bacterium]